MKASEKVQCILEWEAEHDRHHGELEVHPHLYSQLWAEVRAMELKEAPPSYLGVLYPVTPFGKQILKLCWSRGQATIKPREAKP